MPRHREDIRCGNPAAFRGLPQQLNQIRIEIDGGLPLQYPAFDDHLTTGLFSRECFRNGAFHGCQTDVRRMPQID